MELQAVIMAAGHGSRMTDLTEKTAKALLPVANMPMIWYPVQLLERAGFTEALVVCQERHRADIQKSLEEICCVKIQLQFATIPDNRDWGTADTLRHIRDRINRDILVLSSDLITDISLHLLADVHRTYDSTLTMLLAPLPDLSESAVPGGKANRKIEKDIIGLDDRGSRVLFMASEADFEETITFRKSILKKHSYIDMRSRLLDSHLYVIKKWVVDYLVEQPSISAIKGELIPHLVKKQFQKPSTAPKSESPKSDIFKYATEDEYSKLAREYSSWNDHHGDLDEAYHGDKIRCYAYVMDGGFCMRANTLLTYCETNRQIPRQLTALSARREIPLVHPTVTVPQRSTVGADSMVGEGSVIKEKVGIKRSIIGSHCNIHEKVKVNNSIIMDHVTLNEGVNLSGCVVCPSATVGEKSELKDCVVGTAINPMSKFTNEMLFGEGQMMEFD